MSDIVPNLFEYLYTYKPISIENLRRINNKVIYLLVYQDTHSPETFSESFDDFDKAYELYTQEKFKHKFIKLVKKQREGDPGVTILQIRN